MSSGVLLGAMWSYFGYRQTLGFEASGDWGYLVFGCVEILIGFFFVARSTPVAVSDRPLDWVAGFFGSFGASFFSPASYALMPSAAVLLYVGIALQLLGVLSLNRSFAIVAAKRSIKTGGMYAFVRHPLYAAHLLTLTSYVLTNTSGANVLVYVGTTALLGVRIHAEERLLAADPVYRTYMSRVRYRLVPFVL